MNFLNKMERKFGRYAIHNLSMWIIICYAIGYFLMFVAGGALQLLNLNPALILQGQVWRLVTWVIVPPSSFGLFTIIMLVFYYSIGNSLEQTWGAFRYNVYIFTGILATAVGLVLLYVIGNLFGLYWNYSASTYYLCLSIFLAFAACYPDMQVMLYFVIPIKIKWLAYLDVAILLMDFIQNGLGGKVTIVISLLNFLVFFLTTRNYRRVSPKEYRRRANFEKQVKRTTGITRHKCAICGRTEQDEPELEFRFCSKCDGNYEYCSDHLFTHEHVKH